MHEEIYKNVKAKIEHFRGESREKPFELGENFVRGRSRLPYRLGGAYYHDNKP